MSQEARGISRNLRLPLTTGQNRLGNRILQHNLKTFSHRLKANMLSNRVYTIT